MEESKYLFMGLLLLTLSVLIVVAGGLWSLNFFGFNLGSRIILIGLGSILSLLGLILILGLVGILFTIYQGKTTPLLVGPTKLVISYFLPVIIQIGSFLGFEREEIMSSFVELGNQLVDPKDIDVEPEKVLILTPHCLQWTGCKHRVTTDWSNCQHCGQCQVQDLIKLTEKYGVKLRIATGGTMARQQVKELRPEVIVAVACERDLTSGMKDVYPLPVVGVVNLRPNGPCFNTKVEIEKIDKTLRKILS